jgi:hypothetical protein
VAPCRKFRVPGDLASLSTDAALDPACFIINYVSPPLAPRSSTDIPRAFLRRSLVY